MTPTHACRRCEVEFPATAEHFYKAGRYFNWICKPCMITATVVARRARDGRPSPRSMICEHCNGAFVSAKRHVRHCSLRCHVDARHVAERAARLASKLSSPRLCVRCGGPIDPSQRTDAKFCSAACNSAAHAQTRKFRKRVGGQHSRRGDEPLISLAAIAERDDWRCGICGGHVARTLRHPAPMAPSIDHAVPVSLGGSNDAANLQLAHLRCNLSKRDSARELHPVG